LINYLLSPLEKLAVHVNITALDVGARGNIKPDLELIKHSVDWLRFEPDESGFTSKNDNDWRSVSYIPYAVAAREETFNLHIYKRRGCSSKYTADKMLASLFSRGGYYELDDEMKVHGRPLDSIVSEYALRHPAFLKIDVQGMEIECFSGAKGILENDLVGIRTEVSFLPIYIDQPLFANVDQALRPFGFQPMLWIEMHEWRRTTRTKLPVLDPGPMPYSRGQIVHGDLLYLLQPEQLRSSNETEIQRLVRLGIISTCYDLFDHALAVFEREEVRNYCHSIIKIDPVELLEKFSKEKSRRYKGIRRFIRHVLNRLL